MRQSSLTIKAFRLLFIAVIYGFFGLTFTQVIACENCIGPINNNSQSCSQSSSFEQLAWSLSAITMADLHPAGKTEILSAKCRKTPPSDREVEEWLKAYGGTE